MRLIIFLFALVTAAALAGCSSLTAKELSPEAAAYLAQIRAQAGTVEKTTEALHGAAAQPAGYSYESLTAQLKSYAAEFYRLHAEAQGFTPPAEYAERHGNYLKSLEAMAHWAEATAIALTTYDASAMETASSWAAAANEASAGTNSLIEEAKEAG